MELNPDGVRQLAELLRDATVPDTNVQSTVLQRLAVLNTTSDTNMPLTFILVTPTHDETLRKSAGLVLKTNIDLQFETMHPFVQQYIKSELLSALSSPLSPEIQKTIANVINAIAVRVILKSEGGLCDWPELVPFLADGLKAQDPNTVEGYFDVLDLLCDDIHEQNVDFGINSLIDCLLSLLESEQNTIQYRCLSCLGHFLQPQVVPMIASNIRQLVQGLVACTSSSDQRVRKLVCHTLTTLAELQQLNAESVSQVVKFMIEATDDTDETTGFAAAKFWPAICEQSNSFDFSPVTIKAVLEPILDQLVPLLFRKLTYSQDELKYIEERFNNTNEHMHSPEETNTNTKITKNTTTNNTTTNNTNTTTNNSNGDGDGEDGDGSSDGASHSQDSSTDNKDEGDWNIRKVSASGLEILAQMFGDKIWSHLQPHFQKCLDSPNWRERETAGFVLGVIASGSVFDESDPQFTQLMLRLCALLKDSEPFVRSISCWSVSRYLRWLAEQDTEHIVRPVLENYVVCVVDPHKNLQEAACSALATIASEGDALLVSHLEVIVPALMKALQFYEAKNIPILCDAIGSLATAAGAGLNNNEGYGHAIMDALMVKWSLDVFDNGLRPLMECLTDVITAVEIGEPRARQLLSRACATIEHTLTLHIASLNGTGRSPDLDPVIRSLDLLSALCISVQNGIGDVIGQQHPPLMPLLLQCLEDDTHLTGTHQSALALLGDLAKTTFPTLEPHIAVITECMATKFTNINVAVRNNVSWAVGEMALQMTAEQLTLVVEVIAPKVIEIVVNPTNIVHSSLVENCSITIGRLGTNAPVAMSRNLGSFIQRWCYRLWNIHDSHEKLTAYQGLVKMVDANLGEAIPHFAYVCQCIALCNLNDAALNGQFQSLLMGYKMSVGEQEWTNLISGFESNIRTTLQTKYQL